LLGIPPVNDEYITTYPKFALNFTKCKQKSPFLNRLFAFIGVDTVFRLF